MATVLKTVIGASLSRVQIPAPPHLPLRTCPSAPCPSAPHRLRGCSGTGVASARVASNAGLYVPLPHVRARQRSCSVDIGDLAEVAIAVLTSPGHEGKTYPLTGPESLSMSEVAEKLSAATGKTIRYVDVPPEEANKARLAAGMPPYLAEGLDELFAERRKGKESKVVADDQRRLRAGADQLRRVCQAQCRHLPRRAALPEELSLHEKEGAWGAPPRRSLTHAVARRFCLANRLPTVRTTRIPMIHADQASDVTAAKPSAHGLTKRITARTAGITSRPPASFIAAFNRPARAMRAPSTYAADAATPATSRQTRME